MILLLRSFKLLGFIHIYFYCFDCFKIICDMFLNFRFKIHSVIKYIDHIDSNKYLRLYFAYTFIKHQYVHHGKLENCWCTTVWNKIEMADVTTPVLQPAELVLQRGARGSRDGGRKWLQCLYVRRLTEGQAGFCCGPDFFQSLLSVHSMFEWL